MIELKPNINKLSPFYRRPVCEGEVSVKDFIIPGMRDLAELKCKKCGREFLADLPTAFGISYQTIIDKEKLEIKTTEVRKWAQDLLESYKNKTNEENNYSPAQRRAIV